MVAVTTQKMKFSIKDFFSKFDQISSFLKFPKLDYPRVCLIIIQNIGDKEYFKWCLVRKLHPANNQPTRITKADKDFARKVLKFPVEIRDIHRIKKKNSIAISVFRYEHKERYKIYVSKNALKKYFLID